MWSATFDDRDANAIVQHVRRNRRAALCLVTENVNDGRDQTMLARAVRQQLHIVRGVGMDAGHKPLITKINSDLRVQWCKKPGTGIQRCGKM